MFNYFFFFLRPEKKNVGIVNNGIFMFEAPMIIDWDVHVETWFILVFLGVEKGMKIRNRNVFVCLKNFKLSFSFFSLFEYKKNNNDGDDVDALQFDISDV